MRIEETEIAGLCLLYPFRQSDNRGSFLKLHHSPTLSAAGLASNFPESFLSVSSQNTIRGMHFQKAPAQHVKVVTCLAGKAIDVILDMRPHSATLGKHLAFILEAQSSPQIYIPEGCAHGFLAIADNTTMHYMVTSVHAPLHDCGIRYDSFGYEWPCQEPIISDRDLALPAWSMASP